MNIAQYIDYAVLKADATYADVIKACNLAKEYHFASVCVRPDYIPGTLKHLKDFNIPVSTVVAFPLGYGDGDEKAAKVKAVIGKGASEVDLVMNIGAFKAGIYQEVAYEIRRSKKLMGNKVLKVIIETSLLTPEEIVFASVLAEENGADFIKTSTGYAGGATVEAVQLILDVVEISVKASGSIKTKEAAEYFIKMGCKRLGMGSIEGIL